MTDKPDTTAPEPIEAPAATPEPAEEATVQQPDEPATHAAPARSSGMLPMALAGIALAVGAGSAFYAWQLNARINDVGVTANKTQAEIARQVAEVRAVRGAQELAESLRGRTNALAARQDGLEQSIQTLAAAQQSGKSRIAYNDVRELLLAANHRMILARDFDTAITALQMADARLQTLADPAALEVRRQVADDLSRLRTSERPDVSGLSLRLSALSDRIDALPLATDTGFKRTPDDGKKTADESPADTINGVLQQLRRDLSGLVRVQPLDAKQAPLLPPEQRYFLRENLRLTLSGAQVALLRGATPAYRKLIGSARSWIERHYDRQSDAVKGALGELEALEKANIEVAVVDISGSLKAVDAILQSGNSP